METILRFDESVGLDYGASLLNRITVGITVPDYGASLLNTLNFATRSAQTATYQLIQNSFDNRGLIDTIERAYSIYGFTADFSFDAIGRLFSIFNNAPGTASDLTVSQSYNPASQIATQTRSNDAYSWTGSVAVNRAYTTNGLNQYTAAGAAGFTFDANGNLITEPGVTYVYDIENRLVGASGAKTAGLVYDPMGRLWQVTGTGTNTRFLYDEDELVAEYDSAGAMARRYVHSDSVDDPVVQYDGANVGASYRRFLMPDERGSIAGLFDNGGATIARNSYDEYGIPGSANVGRFQYTGQIWLPELGMYYYKARIYSPTLGRFLQVDPIGYDDQINLYAYVGNDPTNKGDPTGTKVDILQSGKNVILTFDIAFYGPGNDAATRARFERAIEHYWTGQFGEYNVVARVNSYTFKAGTQPEVQYTYPSNMNFVLLLDNNKYETVEGGRYAILGNKRPDWTIGHLAGHFAGLPDMWTKVDGTPVSHADYENDIMGAKRGSPPTETTITDMLRTNRTDVRGGPDMKEPVTNCGSSTDGQHQC